MNLDQILDDYADKVGGKVIPYTEDQSVIVIPTKHGRFQQVIGWTKKTKDYKFLEFDSKVCRYTPDIDLKNLMELAATKYVFARLIIKNDFIQLASSVVLDHATPELITDMIKEVANEADELEFQLTGKDDN